MVKLSSQIPLPEGIIAPRSTARKRSCSRFWEHYTTKCSIVKGVRLRSAISYDGGMDSCTIRVRVTPRAARDQIDGWQGDVLGVRVTAPPVEGKANAAVLRLLAEALNVSASRMEIIRGQAARDKVIRVDGLTGGDARRCLGALL